MMNQSQINKTCGLGLLAASILAFFAYMRKTKNWRITEGMNINKVNMKNSSYLPKQVMPAGPAGPAAMQIGETKMIPI